MACSEARKGEALQTRGGTGRLREQGEFPLFSRQVKLVTKNYIRKKKINDFYQSIRKNALKTWTGLGFAAILACDHAQPHDHPPGG
jgi:hypothetical protein